MFDSSKINLNAEEAAELMVDELNHNKKELTKMLRVFPHIYKTKNVDPYILSYNKTFENEVRFICKKWGFDEECYNKCTLHGRVVQFCNKMVMPLCSITVTKDKSVFIYVSLNDTVYVCAMIYQADVVNDYLDILSDVAFTDSDDEYI